MDKLNEYLDEVIRRGEAKNDSGIARRLGVSRQAVSGWRAGVRYPEDEAAAALEQVLGKRPGELMAEFQAARAKTPEMRTAWEHVARVCATASIIMTSGFIALSAVTPAPAEAASQLAAKAVTFCIMSIRIIRQRAVAAWRSMLRSLPAGTTAAHPA